MRGPYVRYALYDTVDNVAAQRRIFATGSRRLEHLALAPKLGQEIMQLPDDGTHYSDATHAIEIVNGLPVPIEKPPLPVMPGSWRIAADGVDEAVFSGIPAGARIRWPDRSHTTADGSNIAFTVDLPGRYRIEISHRDFMKTTVEVVAS